MKKIIAAICFMGTALVLSYFADIMGTETYLGRALIVEAVLTLCCLGWMLYEICRQILCGFKL